MDWIEKANCRDADRELFFPERGGSPWPAKKICQGCDVREECLEWAMDNSIKHGIWGGMGEKGRRALRSKRWHAERGTKAS